MNSKESGVDQETESPRYIISIGASAGGLEALYILFANLPSDTGATFIVVQHLSPDFKSLMDQLLAKHTNMPVRVAEDGEQVLPNHIYLNPPKKNMRIVEGKLLFADLPPHPGLNLPIDTFFQSLAEDQQHRAIAVILSGTGSDGSRGVHTIKEGGGLVVVQHPANAQFDGMPNSAINTGFADVILSVDEIASKLVSYLNHPLSSQSKQTWKTHLATHERTLQDIFHLLHDKHQIDFSEYKPSTVACCIERRLGLNEITTLNDYYAFLIETPGEVQTLYKELLVGVTRFFRDAEAFDCLAQKVLPVILQNKKATESIRIWATGISTGEEAFSIAMLMHEVMNKGNQYREIKIFATDVDPEAISIASSNLYSATICDDVNENRIQHFFHHHGANYCVTPRLRQSVVFAVHDLTKDPPFSNMDLIVCRNMLSYLQHSTQQKALSLLHFSLTAGGYLFLGPSESLGELRPYFDNIDQRTKIYRKNHIVRTPIKTRMSGQWERRISAMPSVSQFIKYHHTLEPRHSLVEVNQTLLEAYCPPCIVLNAQNEAIHTYGDSSDFIKKIQPGRVSIAIKDLIEDSLSMAVTTAIHKISRDKKDVVYKNVRLKTNDFDRLINLRVKYIDKARIRDNLTLLIFEKRKINGPAIINETEIFNERDYAQQRIFDLEIELRHTLESRQTTVEELEITNEELQSTNEELTSANEELQSTNEELQSVNEELYTVNSKHQQKIHELTQTNNDLDNLLCSQEIATLFLDKQMLIRRFTPTINKYINIIPLDQDRPFAHISHKLKIDNLLDQISAVLKGKRNFRKQVYTEDGSSVILRITAYINEQGHQDGVVLTLLDLNELADLLNQPNKHHRSTEAIPD